MYLCFVQVYGLKKPLLFESDLEVVGRCLFTHSFMSQWEDIDPSCWYFSKCVIQWYKHFQHLSHLWCNLFNSNAAIARLEYCLNWRWPPDTVYSFFFSTLSQSFQNCWAQLKTCILLKGALPNCVWSLFKISLDITPSLLRKQIMCSAAGAGSFWSIIVILKWQTWVLGLYNLHSPTTDSSGDHAIHVTKQVKWTKFQLYVNEPCYKKIPCLYKFSLELPSFFFHIKMFTFIFEHGV